MIPTPAFIGAPVVESIAGTLGQTLPVVTDSFPVATGSTVIKARTVTRGTVGVAMHALLLLLTGKEAIRTVIHTLPRVDKVVLVTLWQTERKRVTQMLIKQ